jgi:predicted AlkP superfamily phosphohydrolase/phosphomutase
MKKPQAKKVFVLGIDGLPPQLVFEKYKKHLPTFARLMERGVWGRLKTTIPPSSIVAWTSMASGKDPGETGIHSYTQKPGPHTIPRLTDSTDIKASLLWDILTQHNKKTIALNIPLTYPAHAMHGVMVTDFLTPAFNEKSIYPPTTKTTIRKLLGGKEYLFDVSGFTGYKKLDLDHLIKKTYEMTDRHFKVAKYFLEKKQWDLFFMVVIGGDRLHHMFWKHIDPQHKNFVKNSIYKNVILEFYQYLDRHLKTMLSHIPKETSVLIVSDHGMYRMDNRINLNDWLIKENYLVIKKEMYHKYQNGAKKLELKDIDWKHTRALASGGYQGRIYIFSKNKKATARTIMEKLKAIRGPKNKKLENRVFDTSTLYIKRDSNAPEIIAYFDNLRYGVNNDVGNKGLYSTKTSVGIDDAGHSPEGSLIMQSTELKKKGDLGTIDILQVTPTILKMLGVPNYKTMRGKPLI